MSKSKYGFYQESSLSQKLADKHPEYTEYAGSDPKTSLLIARLNTLIKFKLLDPKDEGVKLIIALLQEKRKALFATSEKTNEITKMGLQMPKPEDVISTFGED